MEKRRATTEANPQTDSTTGTLVAQRVAGGGKRVGSAQKKRARWVRGGGVNLESGTDIDALIRVKADHPLDEILGLLADVIVFGEIIFARDNCLVRRHIRVSKERVVAEEHDKRDQSDAPNIYRLAVGIYLPPVASY